MTPPAPVLYLDASALVKLVLLEAESVALLDTVRREVDLVTSVVGRIETFRAVLRAVRASRRSSSTTRDWPMRPGTRVSPCMRRFEAGRGYASSASGSILPPVIRQAASSPVRTVRIT